MVTILLSSESHFVSIVIYFNSIFRHQFDSWAETFKHVVVQSICQLSQLRVPCVTRRQFVANAKHLYQIKHFYLKYTFYISEYKTVVSFTNRSHIYIRGIWKQVPFTLNDIVCNIIFINMF